VRPDFSAQRFVGATFQSTLLAKQKQANHTQDGVTDTRAAAAMADAAAAR